MFRVGLIGFGLIGRQRLAAVDAMRATGIDAEVVGIYDPFAEQSDFCSTIDDLVDRTPDLMILATPHDTTVELLRRLLPTGLQVLAEKPIGRSLQEFQVLSQLRTSLNQVCVGLNYQYFEGLAALIEDSRKGVFGTGIKISIEMGHGGSPGDEKSWKLDPMRAGGGALLDPGIHLFDLAATLGGDSITVQSCISSAPFWQTGVEEVATTIMRSDTFPIIELHVSVAQWRSGFRVEVIGTEGYGIVEGRGRSYGRQTYVRGKRWGFLSGASQRESEERVVETDCEQSFRDELIDIAQGGPASRVRQSFVRMGVAMRLVDECRFAAGIKIPRFV